MSLVPAHITRTSRYIFTIICLSPIIYVSTTLHSTTLLLPLIIATLVSMVAFMATYLLLPPIAALNLEADLAGIDINKKGLPLPGHTVDEKPKKIPESAGVVPATIFLICITLCQLIYVQTPAQLAGYGSALSTITFIIFLGFADDVLNLRWRYKLLLPPIASLSLLLAYAGSTTVVVPSILRQFLGTHIDLGIFYRLYMLLLTTFCSNAINIHAGLNGLEVGQSVVIACSILTHNLVELRSAASIAGLPSGGLMETLQTLMVSIQQGWSSVIALIFNQTTSTPTASQAAANLLDPATHQVWVTAQETHLFSAILVLPFLATSLALLAFNWYPSQVFVGDTYTYFAGVTFAVCGILGHFSKTLLLFFIPQILNFLYSLPQLVGIVHCPRHRLPKLNVKTGKLEGIPSNMNLINLALLICGPMTEHALCLVMMAFQILCCACGFFVRYYVSDLLYR